MERLEEIKLEKKELQDKLALLRAEEDAINSKVPGKWVLDSFDFFSHSMEFSAGFKKLAEDGREIKSGGKTLPFKVGLALLTNHKDELTKRNKVHYDRYNW